MGRLDEAAALYAEAERLGVQHRGSAHYFVGAVREDLGLLYRRRGRSDLAESYLREAARTYGEALGDTSIMTVRAQIWLGNVLRERQAFAEAESLLLAGYTRYRARQVTGRIDPRRFPSSPW